MFLFHQIVFELFGPNEILLFKLSKPVCEYFKSDKVVWPGLAKASNMPQNNPCPFPKGNYTIKNYVVDDSKFGPIPPGKYTAKGKLVEDGKILTQVEIISTLKV